MRRWLAVPAVIIAAFLPAGVQAEEDPFVAAREAMVRRQLEGRDITDPRVLAAMKAVRRHAFMPRETWDQAYGDHPVAIGQDQTISQPYIVALMTQLANVAPGDRVLEVGTGSGYQAAVLAQLGADVYSIEIVEPLARNARIALDAQGYGHVHTRTGDGYRGWPSAAPFDAIVVTAAPDHIPRPLLDQLALGGRLVIPVGGGWHQELLVIERTATGHRKTRVTPVLFVPMTGEAQGR